MAILGVAVLAGCSSGDSGEPAPEPSTPPSAAGPVLDGLYKLDFDVAKRTALGAPSPRTEPLSARWAFTSHCAADNVCIATATRMKADGSAMDVRTTLDLVNGKWIMALGSDSKCNQGGQPARVLGAWVLEPHPDNSLTGTWTEITTGADCPWVTQMPVTATRQGEVPENFPVEDPSPVAARNPSRAEAFQGAYTQTVTSVPSDGVPASLAVDVATYCVRNTDECASTQATMIDDDPQMTPLTFTGDRWTYRWDRGERTCGPGGAPVKSFGNDDILFPEPAVSPIPTLTGTRRLESLDPCPGEQLFDLRYDHVAPPPPPPPGAEPVPVPVGEPVPAPAPAPGG